MVGLLAAADTIEEAMANAGYRANTEAMRPANEMRFEARWRLGRMLAKVERQQIIGPGRGNKTVSRAGTSFLAYLKHVGLNKNRANECERIGAMERQRVGGGRGGKLTVSRAGTSQLRPGPGQSSAPTSRTVAWRTR
jgi:hypothetical protein